MEYTYPDYYKKFKCTADKCSDTCCAGWGIAIDRQTLQKYRKVKGPFGNRLKNSVDWREHSFRQYENKRCAFLNEENKCDIHLEAGEDMLCKTCRRYPRHYEEYENLREISLSLSCPEAAKLILGTRKPLTLETVEQERDIEEYDYFDFFLFTKLQDIREFLFETIRRTELSLGYRMALMLAQTHDIQNRLNRHQMFAVDELLERYRKPGFQKQAEKKCMRYADHREVRCYLMHGLMYRLHQLEMLHEDWEPWLEDCEHVLYEDISPSVYWDYAALFQEAMKERSYEYERLLEYFIYSYFCGAVYDGNILNKVKLAVVHTILIREMDLAFWIAREGEFSFEDQIEIAHRYAREIEHSDLNLERMERMVSEDPFFDLDHLLSCVLG